MRPNIIPTLRPTAGDTWIWRIGPPGPQEPKPPPLPSPPPKAGQPTDKRQPPPVKTPSAPAPRETRPPEADPFSPVCAGATSDYVPAIPGANLRGPAADHPPAVPGERSNTAPAAQLFPSTAVPSHSFAKPLGLGESPTTTTLSQPWESRCRPKTAAGRLNYTYNPQPRRAGTFPTLLLRWTRQALLQPPSSLLGRAAV